MPTLSSNGWVQSLDWTTGLLDWNTGLTQTAKYTSFSAEQKLNVLIPSITLLPTESILEFQRSKVTYTFTFGGYA